MRTEDGYVISKCLSGDKAAFGLLVDKYKESIYALAYAKLGNFHDAEDVTQEVFIKAYEKLSTLKRWDNFFAWVYSITSNLCKMHLRAKARRRDSAYLAEQDRATFDALAVEQHRKAEEHETLYAALAALPETYRQALTLHYFSGLKSREIASLLGVSKNTIDQRLFQARQKLKTEMIAMMNATFDEMKLQPGFTFRVVEAIKETKIQPAPHKTALPYGVSVVAGLIVLMLSLSLPQSPLYPIGQVIGSALPSQMQVLEEGEIAVDAIQVDRIISLSPEMDKGDLGREPLPEPTNVFGGGTWERKADMPTGRASVSVNSAVVDGEIYVIGGWSQPPFRALSTVEAYNPATGKWTKKADMPTPRAVASTAVVDGKIYAIGGVGSWGVGSPAVPTVEVYDPTTDSWEKRADMRTRRLAFDTAVVDGKIYAISGGDGFGVGKRTPTVEVYDPVADKWEEKTNIPTPRGDSVAVTVNGKIYVIGGTEQIVPLRFSQSVEVYSPAENTWTRGTDILIPVGAFAVSTLNGRIYLFGGYDANNRQTSIVQEYDPATDTWVRKTDMPRAKASLTAATVDNKIYVIGGATNGFSTILSTVDAFDPDFEDAQSVNPAGKLPTTWGEQKAAQ